MNNLKEEFNKFGKWITQFRYGEEVFGGPYEAYKDERIEQFAECLRDIKVKSILELGPLEGGHTIRLANISKKVTALEGRVKNIEKCEFIKTLFRKKNITFVHGDINSIDTIFTDVKFDAILCCGVLYHIRKPWELINKLSKISDRIFIWTHYMQHQNHTEEGYSGVLKGDGIMENPTDALEKQVFWLDRDSILNSLKNNSFTKIKMIRDHTDHPAGSALTLFAEKE